MVNVMFVLLLLGILYAWMRGVRGRDFRPETENRRSFWKQMLLMPHILLVSLLLGMFHWTNYWDFVIYFVVAGGVILFANIVMFEGGWKKVLSVTAAQAAEMLVLSTMVILPFTLKFETMVQGVALAENHSLPHQLLILWGLPAGLTFLFVAVLLWEKLRGGGRKTPYRFLAALKTPDMFAVILGLCAAGLVLIPELVYVRDIYENGNARANTMFKLTYQAYIMFAMTMVYVISDFWLFFAEMAEGGGRSGTVPSCMDLGIFRKQRGFLVGNVSDPSQYQGLNATAFLNGFPRGCGGDTLAEKQHRRIAGGAGS